MNSPIGAILIMKRGISGMAKKFTLGKNERLKSRKSIDFLFSEGKRISVPPFRLHYRIQPAKENLSTSLLPLQIKMGVGVSVKHFKKAVDRNRVKRLVRETYRLQKPVLSAKPRNGELDIFIIYNDRELPEYQDLYEKMGLLLKKLELSLP